MWVLVPLAGGYPVSIGAGSGSDAWSVGRTGGGLSTREVFDHWTGRTWTGISPRATIGIIRR